jgi:type III pantothenate kinase
MDLLLDIGNSRVKWAFRSGRGLTDAGATGHGDIATHTDEWLARISGSAAPDAVLIANVAGADWERRMTAGIRERWGLTPRFAVTRPSDGRLRNGYRDHRQLGIDRWLALGAAVDQFAGPLCVIDAGTALTADLVTGDGRHLGGYIVPGLDLMPRSLAAATGDLERFSGDRQPAGRLEPGRDTAAAIANGALTSICGLVDRCVDALPDRDKVVTLVVTGGDAERLLPHLDDDARHRPLLVLEGLARYDFAEPAA